MTKTLAKNLSSGNTLVTTWPANDRILIQIFSNQTIYMIQQTKNMNHQSKRLIHPSDSIHLVSILKSYTDNQPTHPHLAFSYMCYCYLTNQTSQS